MTNVGNIEFDRETIIKDKTLEQKAQYLKEYYKHRNTVLIGLNDSQGVDTSLLFRKGILEYVRDMLSYWKDDIDIFNAFSLLFNKTEHIDYFLDANLSLEEVKQLQVEGMVSALSKFFHTDLNIPKVLGDLGKIGYISKALYRTNENDSKFRLTDTLIKAKEPIVVYSSGANDLMREGWCNPFSIGKAYKNRNVDPTYHYALQKFQNPNTVKGIIERVEHNFEHILFFNDETDIFALGLYLPATMKKEGMEVFDNAIKEYNIQLQELCKKYRMTYISTDLLGSRLSKDNNNFHASYNIQKLLAEQLIKKLYDKKTFCAMTNSKNYSKPQIESSNLLDVMNKLEIDIKNVSCEQKCLEDKLSQKVDLGVFEEDNNLEQVNLFLQRERDICTYKIKELQRQTDVVSNAWKKTLKKK